MFAGFLTDLFVGFLRERGWGVAKIGREEVENGEK